MAQSVVAETGLFLSTYTRAQRTNARSLMTEVQSTSVNQGRAWKKHKNQLLTPANTRKPNSYRAFSTRVLVVWLLYLSTPFWVGCAAFRPLDGIPVRYTPDELKATSRTGKKTIDLSLLAQPAPANNEYRVDSGDVLGVYIESVLGNRETPPPVYFPPMEDAPPSLGYPIPVRSDGTI